VFVQRGGPGWTMDEDRADDNDDIFFIQIVSIVDQFFGITSLWCQVVSGGVGVTINYPKRKISGRSWSEGRSNSENSELEIDRQSSYDGCRVSDLCS
jgi:hypothetical protein